MYKLYIYNHKFINYRNYFNYAYKIKTYIYFLVSYLNLKIDWKQKKILFIENIFFIFFILYMILIN